MSDDKLEAALAKLRNKKNYLTENSTFPFGKHEGETVGFVLDDNPDYIMWWDDEVESPCIRPSLVISAEMALEEMCDESDAPWEKWD